MNPLARKDKLTTRELPDELLVYDLERHTMHCLNRTAALVWQHCDGQHDEAALAELLTRELQLAPHEAAAAARLALEQLSRRQLLQEQVAAAPAEERLTRRTALRRMAVAAAAAIPLVMTLRSPSVAWAAPIGCNDTSQCPTPACQIVTCPPTTPQALSAARAFNSAQLSPVIEALAFGKFKGVCVFNEAPDGTACGNGGTCINGFCKECKGFLESCTKNSDCCSGHCDPQGKCTS
jgi:hypothetical protein